MWCLSRLHRSVFIRGLLSNANTRILQLKKESSGTIKSRMYHGGPGIGLGGSIAERANTGLAGMKTGFKKQRLRWLSISIVTHLKIHSLCQSKCTYLSVDCICMQKPSPKFSSTQHKEKAAYSPYSNQKAIPLCGIDCIFGQELQGTS